VAPKCGRGPRPPRRPAPCGRSSARWCRARSSRHQDHPLAGDQLAHRVELDLHPEVADRLLRLDEGAAHVVVADQPEFERQAGLPTVAQGGEEAAVRAPARRCPPPRSLAGQAGAHLQAHLGDRVAEHLAVGPGEVDVLEDAAGGLRREVRQVVALHRPPRDTTTSPGRAHAPAGRRGDRRRSSPRRSRERRRGRPGRAAGNRRGRAPRSGTGR